MIQKKKICVECNKESYIFSRKCCRNCWNKLYSKALRRVGKDKTRKTELREEQFKKDVNFYMTVWNTREHVCENCKTPLYEPLLQLFHHILAKAKYPQYRYKKWNIMLLCWQCHDAYERNPDTRPYIKNKRLELLEIIEND